jgi:hypothetical protein
MSSQMPIAIRASASWRRRRWLKSRYRIIEYDARFADGHEEHAVDLNATLQGARFPSDYWSARKGADEACPKEGAGTWVDYPYGRPLTRLGALRGTLYGCHWRRHRSAK